MQTKIDQHFQGVNSTSIQNAMRHVKSIHERLCDLAAQERAQRTPRIKPIRTPRELTELEQELIQLAPQHTKNGLYDVKQILAKLREKGHYAGVGDKKARQLISERLDLLKSRRDIKKLKLEMPTYKTATPEEITQNEGLIAYVLYKKRTLVPPYWREHISREEAMQVGRLALKDAIERFDPTEHPKKFGTYAAKYIGGRIAQEIDKIKRRNFRQTSIHEQNVYTGRTVEDTIGKNDDVLEDELLQKIKAMHALHLNGAISFPNFSLWVLNKLGHGSSSLGRFFGCSKQVIDARLHILKEKEKIITETQL